MAEFGLDLTYIIASTHDGAAVMQKDRRIIHVESQLSHNHGIHLAVTDVFYKKSRTCDSQICSSDESNEEDADESDEANNFDEDNDLDSDCKDNEYLKVSNRSDIFDDIKESSDARFT